MDALPVRDDLVADLKLLREKGLSALPKAELPALASVARILTSDPELSEHVLVETVVRRAAAQLGGGAYGVAAGKLLGLGPDERTLTAGIRRVNAAAALGISERTLRRRHEGCLLEQLADQILRLCTDQRLTEARRQLNPRSPVESAISLHWIEMFQAYYRLYSPICALGADLTAYRSTLLEEPRPYDRRFGTSGPEDLGYSQEDQAEGYASFALYHYARFEWELQRFLNRYGGMWMLTDPQAEQDAPDAVHRISWHVSPFNERDQSLLRTLLDETPNQELHGFLELVAKTDLGRSVHPEWLEWAASCACVWEQGADVGAAYYPTSCNQRGIYDACQVHKVIEACGDYMRLIDEDWNRAADWYRIPDRVRRDVSDEQRYAHWRHVPSRAPR